MDKSIEILEKINWFLKPVSDLIIFLFTNKLGIFILFLSIILIFIFIIYNRIRERKLLYSASTNSSKLPFKDLIFIISDEFTKFIAKIISNFTVIIVVIFIMLAIVGLSNTFTTIDNFLTNRKKIKELTLVLKNLNQRYKVAKVEIIDYDFMKDSTELKVKFYDYAKSNYVPNEQNIKLPGHDIYFLTYVMNFEYSLIENGKNINIALPYMIFSEKLTQKNGIRLKIKDKNGMPYVFHRDSNDLYGLSLDVYNDRMKEIISYMNNPELARKAGVRSFYSAAPHYVKALRSGQTFIIWIEQTGGLVIKQDE